MFNPRSLLMRVIRDTGTIFAYSIILFLCAIASCQAQSPRRSVRVWLIPAENAGPNDVAQGERIPEQLDDLRHSLEGSGVRLLNVEMPLAMKAIFWNPQFNVPNFQVVATQRKTLEALKEFARRNNVEVVVRFVTWDEAFGLLDARQTEGPDALPDVAQIGSSWAGYFAGLNAIMSRPDSAHNRGNWRDVLGIPASALPYSTDVRLLFYWKRLPAAEPDSKPLELNNSSWRALMDSLRNGTDQGDTLVFPTGVTLNLLHDYLPLVWAGTGHRLLSTGALGTSIDISSDSALSVPAYLASQTQIRQADGGLRRLISFPEASHQEASRTFVNGGYRGTIEPANFIGQWVHDFEERQDVAEKHGQARRKFWDYAAAVVPPATFKGGSELVILNHAQDPVLAASLADYLATDRDYTKVLADAGLLPAGRPGYGIRELIESFDSERESVGARSFSEAVQKAIDQGVQYPDFEKWPSVFENHQVLESLQRVWRRMGEGDVKGMKLAAESLQGQINSQIYIPTRTWDAFSRAWPLLLIVSASLVALIAWVRARSLRRLITILHLYRASRHESVKVLGDNVSGTYEDARTGKLDHQGLMHKLRDLINVFMSPAGLNDYVGNISNDLILQVQGVEASENLSDSVMKGFRGAQLFFEAWQLKKPPEITLTAQGLSSWRVVRYPALVTVILQEWFFNCLKEVDWGSGAVINIETKDRAVVVESMGALKQEDVETLTGPHSKGLLPANAHGLVLIRDISYYAFGSHVRVATEDNRIRLSLPLPIRKDRSRT